MDISLIFHTPEHLAARISYVCKDKYVVKSFLQELGRQYLPEKTVGMHIVS